MKAQDVLTNFADLERAAADLSQQPRPPRQRADIVMCDWLGAWWVKRMAKHPHLTPHVVATYPNSPAAHSMSRPTKSQ